MVTQMVTRRMLSTSSCVDSSCCGCGSGENGSTTNHDTTDEMMERTKAKGDKEAEDEGVVLLADEERDTSGLAR